MTTRLNAPITAVTVYPGQARVTRKGTARLAAGDARVLVTGLPTTLQHDSVRVSGLGPATVLGVDVSTERHTRSEDPAVAGLRERRDRLQAELSEVDDASTALDVRVELLREVSRRSAATLARAVAVDDAGPARVAAAGGGLADELGKVLAERRELARRRTGLDEELGKVGRDIAARTNQQEPDRVTVAVDLEVAAEGEVLLEVTYVVDAAGWTSRYDVRLVDDKVTVSWFALVTQHSGEDWPECELALSTARPAKGVAVPELDPWYVGVVPPRPPVMPMAAAPMSGAFGSAPRMAKAEAAVAPPPPSAPMATATAAVEHGAAAAVYRPSRPVAVPADGTAHRATVAVLELDGRVDHVTAPVRGLDAYLRATVVNSSEHTLRPGRASLFHGPEFVGSTALEAWAPGEELELALGVDDRVRVERELVRTSATKKVLGSTRRLESAYRTTVTNHSPRRARVEVLDQVPVSHHESVAVRDVSLRPDPVERDDLGRVTWRFELDPGQKAVVELAVRVEAPKDARLTGWRD